MSLLEVFVVILVALMLLKPKDVPVIIKIFKKLFCIINDFKEEFLDYINSIDEKDIVSKDVDKINFYLQKITSLGYGYNGDYNLEEIKSYYHEIILKKSKKPDSVE